tara:strand:+ start:12086 stop:12415 length:330 start_codon:yes stop_codon:yes gene_type:complete
MKRKDTSKLLNEWKSFLNESQIDNEFIDNLSDENRNALNSPSAREVNEDKEAIFSALHEMGLEDKDILEVLNMMSGMSPGSIAKLAEDFDEESFGSREGLEQDPDLSER